jgi:hypothetical protein
MWYCLRFAKTSLSGTIFFLGLFLAVPQNALALDEEYCKKLNQGLCAQSTPSGGGWLQQLGKCIVSADPGTVYYCYTKPIPVAQCAGRGGKCMSEDECGDQPGISYVGYCESNTSNVCCIAPKGTGTGTGLGGGSGTGLNGGATSGTGTGLNGSVKNEDQAAGQSTISFENPLQFNTVEEVLSSLLKTLQGIIVTLSLVFIVIGAILYVTSGGGDQIKTAKAAITASLIGLALGLAAPSFLKEIAVILDWKDVPGNVGDALTLTEIALNVLSFLLSLVGILAIIMLLVGASMYITSAGSEDRMESGKDIVWYSVIGIVIAFSAMVIVRQIAAFFG